MSPIYLNSLPQSLSNFEAKIETPTNVIRSLFSITRWAFRRTPLINSFFYNSIYRFLMRILFSIIGNVFSFRGARIVTNVEDLSVTPTVWTGQYESNEFDWMEKRYLCQSERLILLIDVGSNIGIYSSVFMRISALFEVICIEPDERSIPFLLENLTFNCHHLTQFQIIKKAVGDKSLKQIFLPKLDPGQSKLIVSDEENDLNIVSLDEVLSKINLERFDEILLKIDVEGNEPQTLLSGLSILSVKRLSILVEYNPTNFESLSAYTDLWSLLSTKYRNATVFTFGRIYTCEVLELTLRLTHDLANILFEAEN